MRWRGLVMLGVAMLGLVPVAAGAGERPPLPEFQVIAADGHAVATADLAGGSRWLLIYIVPDCAACDRLLRALKRWKSDALVERTVIVIGASPAEADAYVRPRLPREVSGIRRFADADGRAWTALGLEGSPVIIGIDQRRVAWTLSGVLKEPGALASALRTWVGE